MRDGEPRFPGDITAVDPNPDPSLPMRDVWSREIIDPFDEQADTERARIAGIHPPNRASTEKAREAYFGIVLPEGYELHHLCENPWCRNPLHLIAVSSADHHKIHGRQTYCIR